MDSNGDVVAVNGMSDKSTAESHAGGERDDERSAFC
jgi:hypothetical protein